VPEEVAFCKRRVMSSQRPSSYPEFKHTWARTAPTMHIDEEGVCDACRAAEQKELIDWEGRVPRLWALCDKHRRNDSSDDRLVPGSGGKDSAYQDRVPNYRYVMHSLTVTRPPIVYTDHGYENFKNWIEVGGFDSISFKPNGRVQKLLTKLSIQNLLHPFQTSILGQKNRGPKIAVRWGLGLIFYGENEAECGNPLTGNSTSLRDRRILTMSHIDEVSLGGVSIRELSERHNVDMADLMVCHLKWTPQESYYCAVDHTGFKARPSRTQGTYSKYNSIDDKIDNLHYYTTYMKFGLGWASYDASQKVRNRHLTRGAAVALVRRFDGEVPDRYLAEIMDRLETTTEESFGLCNKARSPRLWLKRGWGVEAPALRGIACPPDVQGREP